MGCTVTRKDIFYTSFLFAKDIFQNNTICTPVDPSCYKRDGKKNESFITVTI